MAEPPYYPTTQVHTAGYPTVPAGYAVPPANSGAPPGTIVYQQPPAGTMIYQQPGVPGAPGAYPPGAPPPGPPGVVVYQQPGIGGQPAPVGFPSANVWMQIPASIPDCPPGLEYLTTLDQLMVQQKVDIIEAFTDFEENNKYMIRNSYGQNVYFAVEDNDCCTRNCCGSRRSFDMKVLDGYQNEILHFYRPLRCSTLCCCFPCCLQTIEISAGGQIIGRVQEEWTCWSPSFAIKDQNERTVLRIEGPCCTYSCCSDVNFRIVTCDGEEVGRIAKKWSGFAQEYFTDADFFGITFPMDLDATVKATLLAACILIDMMFFENNQGKG